MHGEPGNWHNTYLCSRMQPIALLDTEASPRYKVAPPTNMLKLMDSQSYHKHHLHADQLLLTTHTADQDDRIKQAILPYKTSASCVL